MVHNTGGVHTSLVHSVTSCSAMPSRLAHTPVGHTPGWYKLVVVHTRITFTHMYTWFAHTPGLCTLQVMHTLGLHTLLAYTHSR